MAFHSQCGFILIRVGFDLSFLARLARYDGNNNDFDPHSSNPIVQALIRFHHLRPTYL